MYQDNLITKRRFKSTILKLTMLLAESTPLTTTMDKEIVTWLLGQHVLMPKFRTINT